ncbi:MAG TPA: AAA family ATPase [Candidatus Paceibacterota bacterium]|nr:AAA family ATPase [Candidatus Paceibacterota bacterium]
MSEPIDIAVDLGVVAPSLPQMVSLREFFSAPHPAPPQLIEGTLHQGSKMILGGTSKSNKSWSLLDLAVSVASGQPWWGRRCERAPVAYLNFELQPWAIKQRIEALAAARPECKNIGDNLFVWNLRGHNADLSLLRPKLEEELARHQFGLVILDPAYKLLGNRDENANGEIASLMNEFEAIAQRTGAAVVVAHHFAKGDSTSKNAMDRMSGAGAWARDPDSIIVLTPHEEDNCFTVTSILRNLPQLPEFVVSWDYPLMRVANDLNPEALRRPQSKNKVCSDKEFVDAVLGGASRNYKTVISRARECFAMSEATTNRYLTRLKGADLICHSGGLYWAGHQQLASE